MEYSDAADPDKRTDIVYTPATGILVNARGMEVVADDKLKVEGKIYCALPAPDIALMETVKTDDELGGCDNDTMIALSITPDCLA